MFLVCAYGGHVRLPAHLSGTLELLLVRVVL